ncbi:MAG: hypothetical protein LQ342_003444 [Letrouitia transgressa]|nr:MAG: hypothetical protein LQ342_003444 [Letrouitia transgressa]
MVPFWTSAKDALPTTLAYAPLEANSPQFSSEAQGGKWKGGLSFAQVIRYRESPVGPYDELAILPGYFEQGASTIERHTQPKRYLRITGIWVNSEASLVNGRRNWNIPKHLARFEFVLSDPKNPHSPPASVKVFSVAPSNLTVTDGAPGNNVGPESLDKGAPFFAARFQCVPYFPAFPFRSSWMSYFGFPSGLLQPPIPVGEPPALEMGTETWKYSQPALTTGKAKLFWIDMKQEDGGESQGSRAAANTTDGNNTLSNKCNGKPSENWWPGMRRWQIGLWCPDATLTLGTPDTVGRDSMTAVT